MRLRQDEYSEMSRGACVEEFVFRRLNFFFDIDLRLILYKLSVTGLRQYTEYAAEDK
jgi:hypothetical protein